MVIYNINPRNRFPYKLKQTEKEIPYIVAIELVFWDQIYLILIFMKDLRKLYTRNIEILLIQKIQLLKPFMRNLVDVRHKPQLHNCHILFKACNDKHYGGTDVNRKPKLPNFH